MERPVRFEHHRYLGDKRTQVCYDVDALDEADAPVIGELLASERYLCFAPDTLAEARTAATACGAANGTRCTADGLIVPAGAIRIRSNGASLTGHLAEPRGPLRPRPALVLCHGFPLVGGAAAYAEATLPALAERIAASSGWVVASFAFRGCGESSGDFSLGGWLDDVAAAVTHMAALPAVDGVWLAGFGTGGALALCAAASDARVRGVATLAAPADFDDWAAHPRRLLEFAREVGVIRSVGFPRDLDSWAGELRRVRPMACVEVLRDRSLIVVHGSEDDSVPVLDARVLADRHGAADLRIISGASHDLRLDPRAIAVLIGWLDRQWNRWQITQPAVR